MKTYIQPRHALTLAAPYDVVSGDGLLVGSIFGIATHDALSGADVESQLTGVVEIAKAGSQDWTAAPGSTGTTPTSTQRRSRRTTP